MNSSNNIDYEHEYTTASRPGAYSGAKTFIRELKKRHKKVDKSQVYQWLQSQDAYTLHRNAKKKFKRNKVIVSGIDDTFQIDLVEVSSLSDMNNGNKFILTCIDVFSKYAWTIAIKNKSAKSVLEAFTTIIESGRIPQRIQCDQGNEFLNKMLGKYLTKNKIKMYTLNSEMKASEIERFNRTIKEKMWRYFSQYQTYKYIDVLDDLTESYNKTYLN